MQIGFIGIGVMGTGIAQNLINAGHALKVFDKSPDNYKKLNGNFKIAKSIADTCKDAQLVITMLPSTPHVLAVTLEPDGVLDSLAPGSVFIDMSTIAPTGTLKIYEKMKEKGIDMVDAPVAGGKQGADNGTLTIFIGAENSVYAKIKPLLQIAGKKLLHIGGPGSGTGAKLVHNICNASQVAMFSEALVFGKKMGLDPDKLMEVLIEGSCSKVLHTHIQNEALKHDFDNRPFPAAFMMKDLALARETAEAYGLTLFYPSLSMHLYSMLRSMGKGKNSYVEVIRVFEDLANIEE